MDNNINEAETLRDVLHAERGIELPHAVAIAHVLTGNEDILHNVSDENLRNIRTSCRELSERLLDLAQNITETVD